MSIVPTAEYKTFLQEIKERIHKAQYDVLVSNLAPKEIAIIEGRTE